MKKLFWVLLMLVVLFPALVFADAYGNTDTYGLKWYRFDWTPVSAADGVTTYGTPGWRAAGATMYAVSREVDPTAPEISGTSGTATASTSEKITGRIYKVELDGLNSPDSNYVVTLAAVTPTPVSVGVTPWPVSGVTPIALDITGATIFSTHGPTVGPATVPDSSGVTTWSDGPVYVVDQTVQLYVSGAGTGDGSVTFYYVESNFSGSVGGTNGKVYQFNYTTDAAGDYSAWGNKAINGWIYRIIVDPDSQGGYDLWDFHLYDKYGTDILETAGVDGPGPTQAWSIPSAATAFAIPRFNDGALNLVIDQADGGVSPVQKQGKVRVYYLPNL